MSKRLRELFNSSPVKPVNKTKRDLEARLNADVGPLNTHKTPVSPQQWKFIQELVDGEGRNTLVQAALNAGYPAKTAQKIAHMLTDPKVSPHVVAAIQKYRQDVAERYGTTIERHMRDLQIIRDKALEAGNYSAAVAAEYRRGQALGTIYVDRKEIRHGTIDSMSAEEVRRKLEEIKALYGGPPPQGIIEVLSDEPTGALEAPAEVPEPILSPEELLMEEIRRGERELALQRAAQQTE
jgi:phage terminase small subunit